MIGNVFGKYESNMILKYSKSVLIGVKHKIMQKVKIEKYFR